jgi:uncharacterized membrane protein HdeD (DUF308 family)
MGLSTLFLIRGLVGIVIGILAAAWPEITIAVLVAIFGLYAVLDGVTNLMLGLAGARTHGRSWVHALEGVAGIVVGVLAFIWPGTTALVLVLFIGAWAIVTGVLEIAAAIRLRRLIEGEWLLGLSGVLSVLFGILMFAFPNAGAVSIAWILGIYAAATGIVLIALGLRLRYLELALRADRAARRTLETHLPREAR